MGSLRIHGVNVNTFRVGQIHVVTAGCAARTATSQVSSTLYYWWLNFQ